MISPDPNVGIDEVCVPLHQARILTFPEAVSQYNMEHMRRLVSRGPEWPGANQLERAGGAEVFVLRAPQVRERLSKQLQVRCGACNALAITLKCWGRRLAILNCSMYWGRLPIQGTCRPRVGGAVVSAIVRSN